jgi:hypothetical protein
LSLVPTGKSLFNEERGRFRHGIVTPTIETASRARAYLFNALAGCSRRNSRVVTFNVAAEVVVVTCERSGTERMLLPHSFPSTENPP